MSEIFHLQARRTAGLLGREAACFTSWNCRSYRAAPRARWLAFRAERRRTVWRN